MDNEDEGLAPPENRFFTMSMALPEDFLSDLPVLYESNIHGCLQLDRVYWQDHIVIDGVLYPKGLGMHAPNPSAVPNPDCANFQNVPITPGRGRAEWKLDGMYATFRARIGLAEQGGDEFGGDGVVFRAYLDGEPVFQSGTVLFSTPPIDVELDVIGGTELTLEVDALSTNGADHSVWANARLSRLLTIVAVDIRPGDSLNRISLSGNGLIPVAVLTTDDFDATMVAPLTADFGPGAALESHSRGHEEDVDGDGDTDLVLHFRTVDSQIACGDTSASFNAQTFTGGVIHGSDSISVVRCE